MGGTERVKYTTMNDGNGNQVCKKTRQNKWKMKSGSAMARRKEAKEIHRERKH